MHVLQTSNRALRPFSLHTSVCLETDIKSGVGSLSWSCLYPQDLGWGLAHKRGTQQGLVKTELVHAGAMLEGDDSQSAHGSRTGGRGGAPYSARSSVHSTSGPALVGLVHFCCMGWSSSATQHSSPVPVRRQKLEDAQIKDGKPLRKREAISITCNHNLGNPPVTSSSHLPACFLDAMLEGAVGITG